LLEKPDGKMLTKLKQRVQAMLTAEAKAAYRIGFTPNRVSVIGVILAFLSAVAYTQWQTDRLYLLLATALLLLSGFCDALDGVIARVYQQATPFGGFLDSLLDRYADAAVFMGIILGGLCIPVFGIIALVSSLLVSYARTRAEAAGVKMESIGIAERPERIIMLAVATIFSLLYDPEIVMNIGIVTIAILATLTVLQRSTYAYAELKKKE
jgi:archaetidylinositol phosphate synthase